MFSYEDLERTKNYRKMHLKRFLNQFHGGVINTCHGEYVVPVDGRLPQMYDSLKEAGLLKLWKTLFRCTRLSAKFDNRFSMFLHQVNEGVVNCAKDVKRIASYFHFCR